MNRSTRIPPDSRLPIAAWITTGLFALPMAASGALYVVASPAVVEGFHHLGYPDYFRTMLGVAKLLGVAALLGSKWPTLREWAYAGFTFDLVAASLSHGVRGDGRAIAFPVLLLLLLAFSYRLRQRPPRSTGGSPAPKHLSPSPGPLLPAASTPRPQ